MVKVQRAIFKKSKPLEIQISNIKT